MKTTLASDIIAILIIAAIIATGVLLVVPAATREGAFASAPSTREARTAASLRQFVDRRA